MPQHIEVPVLVVGAGPTGLTLACDLARRGVQCLVVDSAPGLFMGSRGKGLQPRTLEVFDDLGVIETVLRSGAPFPAFRCWAGDAVAWERTLGQMLGIEEPAPMPDVPYPTAWLLPQWRTDEILRDRFVELGGRVQMETKVVGLEQDEHGVSVQAVRGDEAVHIRAAYAMGADGGRSTVRKLLGVGFEGETFPSERTVIGDVKVSGPLDREHCHMLTRTGDVSAASRFSLWGLPGTDYFQLVVNVADRVPELTLDGMQRELEARSGRTDLRLHDLRWISLYAVNVRMASRFRAGRVFLAGDAAHVHSSAGGQGLNTGVQDAYNLGWKLGAVLSGAPLALLDTYEAERVPVAADLLGLTTRWHRSDFAGPPPGPPRSAREHPVFQLCLNYRGGPLSRDERPTPGTLRAGDRAPDAPCLTSDGRPTTLFDLFRGPHATLLAFGAGADALARSASDRHPAFVRAHAVAAPGGEVPAGGIVDHEGHIRRGYDVEAGWDGVVLVRPDGYVGLVAEGPAAGALVDAYLRDIAPR